MKYLNIIGKTLVTIGTLIFFSKVRGSNNYGGYMDSSWYIIILSILFCSIGIFMIFKSNKTLKIKK